MKGEGGRGRGRGRERGEERKVKRRGINHETSDTGSYRIELASIVLKTFNSSLPSDVHIQLHRARGKVECHILQRHTEKLYII